jgi:hypothetical protein
MIVLRLLRPNGVGIAFNGTLAVQEHGGSAFNRLAVGDSLIMTKQTLG